MDIRFPGFYDRGLLSLGDNNQKNRAGKNVKKYCASLYISFYKTKAVCKKCFKDGA